MMKAKTSKFETCIFGESSSMKDIKASVEPSPTSSLTQTSTPPTSPTKDSPPPRPVKPSSASKSEKEVNHVINIQELRRLSSQGVPDDCSFRAIAWRILLGYLPLDTSKWQEVINRDRTLYRNLVKDLFVPSDEHPFEEEGYKLIGKGLNRDGSTPRQYKVTKDGPSRIEEAVQAMNKATLLDQVTEEEKEASTLEIPENVREQWKKSGRDPESLSAGMGGKRSRSCLNRHFNALLVTTNETANTTTNDVHKAQKAEEILTIGGEVENDFDPQWRHFLENATLLDEIRKDVVRTHPDLKFFLEPEDSLGIRRYAAIERILFVWAKLNKGVRYVQGMNEIVGTLYFVLANDENEEWAAEAEADTYFLFNTLMVEMRDIFVPDLDEADTGIHGRMANMLTLLSLHDPEVKCHLDESGIDPGFYSIRWLTTLLSREFLLPDTIRLWDSMFSSTHKDNFMRYVCVCMVMIIREELLEADFGGCLRLLQSYPPTDVEKLLESSRALWIYESQVTLACHKGGISLNQALTTIAPPPAVLMAYGLKGGFAIDQIEKMREHMMRATNTRSRVAGLRRNNSNSTNGSASNGKSYFRGLFTNKK